MSDHKSEPIYKIGDFLVSKVQLQMMMTNPPREHRERHEGPVILHVLGVVTESCPGGTQHHYICRHGAINGFGNETVRLNEVELSPAPTERTEFK